MKILFSSSSLKQLKKINLRFQDKIYKALSKFEKGERVDIKRLKGRDEEHRIRVRNYRLILKKVSNNEFLVIKIGQRENIYLLFLGL